MYFDLELQIRSNPDYRARLFHLLDLTTAAFDRALTDPEATEEYHTHLQSLMEATNYNAALFTPYAWPAYPKDTPLFYSDYPFAFQMFHLQLGGFKVFKGSRQISKSTSFSCRQLLNARLFRAFRSLYIVPRNDQLETYQNKFREIERACRWWRRDSRLRQNLGYKEFDNGSVIEMAYVQTSAHSIRGKSTDELLFDEYQNFDPDLEVEVTQTQSASTMPVTIFAGTSLTTDTALEHKWSLSSMGVWAMRCPSCSKFNLPLPDHGVMDMIQPQGCCCAKCKTLLDVRAGQYIHHDQSALEAGREGYHIPQIIVPAVVYNPLRWAAIYELKLRLGASRKFFQEILGLATEEGEKEITKKQLQAMCILGSIEKLVQKAMNRGYRWVVSGCDWGGSDYNPDLKTKVSTTVHSMLGVCPDGKCDILHFRRYAGMNYDDIAADIIENHNRLSGFALASDFGVGAVYNSKIREKIPPERHLIFNYVGPASDLIKEPIGPHLYNQWSLNKTESISLTYEAVRELRLRCYDWTYAEAFLMDFLNLFRAPGERVGAGTGAGATTFVYRAHPTKPNDALMSVNYAYMLAKILLGEPMFADLATQTYLSSTLAMDLTGIHVSALPGAYSG